MFKPITHNLARLARFSGRDTRETFWPYALTLFVLAMAASALAVMPAVLGAMAKMQRFAAEHPDQATVRQGPGSYSIQIQGSHPELMPDMRGILPGLAIVLLVFVALVAAAVVRRLHDRGKSGAWALPPLIFLVIGMMLMPRLFGTAPDGPNLSLLPLLFVNNLLYLASLGWLMVLLAGDGTVGPNRHGEDPTPPEARQRRRLPPRPRD
ncbi:MAG: DUF805 domain-containing protein [Sphingomonas sp.]|uniref:DUF805 domain-containing protein n=1 Tax=Sphingomonas sp. TaxID=28214 RepID=UPI0025FFACE1|nr:DUF805 domain-containing protein [Sphingomonas sp.]MBQ1499290.1 DUF805 domain-containing protein [Sphingomonas sp.]